MSKSVVAAKRGLAAKGRLSATRKNEQGQLVRLYLGDFRHATDPTRVLKLLWVRRGLLYCQNAGECAVLHFRQKFCLLVEFAALAAKFRRSGGLRSLRV